MQMVGNNLKLIFSYFKLNMLKELEYKTSFILKVIMMILNDAFFILQWYIIFNIVDDIAGYGFTLSTANNKKSISYPNITLLGFDEFLLEKGNQMYLPNEPEKLLNLYETVARPGTDHKRVILFMLANNITITNCMGKFIYII